MTSSRRVSIQAVHYYGQTWRYDEKEIATFDVVKRTLDRRAPPS